MNNFRPNPRPKAQEDNFIPFLYPIKEKVKLPQVRGLKKSDFLETIFRRRSSSPKIFSEISKNQLSELLFYSTRVNSFTRNEKGYILSKRTTPSAGARHPVDLLISPPKSILERELYYYNPFDHSLSLLQLEGKHLESFFSSVNENEDISKSCIVWFSIQHNKTATKYTHPESLYWRDVGALIYGIQLIGTFIGLMSCPLGSVNEKQFNNLFGTNTLVSGGGLLIGT